MGKKVQPINLFLPKNSTGLEYLTEGKQFLLPTKICKFSLPGYRQFLNIPLNSLRFVEKVGFGQKAS